MEDRKAELRLHVDEGEVVGKESLRHPFVSIVEDKKVGPYASRFE
jgi:hypothetical protein